MGIEPPAVAMAHAFPTSASGVVQLRAIPAGEYALFAADHARFWQQSWKVSMQSNRTGYRLAGEPILPEKVVEMRSYGLVPGIVQVIIPLEFFLDGGAQRGEITPTLQVPGGLSTLRPGDRAE